MSKKAEKFTLLLPDLMDQLGETYGVRKCEEMWSLGTDRPGTPCAVKVFLVQRGYRFLRRIRINKLCLQDVDGLWYRARLEKVISAGLSG